jgi:hypothetical protein
MLLRNYLVGKFTRELLTVSLLISLLMVLTQLMQTAHLVLGLPFKLSAPYLIMLVIYAFVISVGFAVFPATVSLVIALNEDRFFHVIYTFGIPLRRVLLYLWGAVLLISAAGAAASYFSNYQKIAYMTKYMKFKFGEEILLTAPPKSFSTFETFSVYFENREGRTFKHFLIKLPQSTATSERAVLRTNGLLDLYNASVFTKMGNRELLIRSKVYTFNIVSPYSYRANKKKFFAEFMFGVAVYLFAFLTFPLIFYLSVLTAEKRLWAYSISFALIVVQFAIALAVKSVLR